MKRTAVLFLLAFVAFTGVFAGRSAAAYAMDSPRPYYVDAKNEYILPIVMYHSTHVKNPGKFTVTPKELERDLIYINKRMRQADEL